MLTGHCECRKIQFQANSDINDFSHCHCSQCRRLHGAAFATFAGVSADKFEYLSGKSELSNYNSSAGSKRLFCRNCGSNIMVIVDSEPGVLYLAMSTIEGNPDRPPAYHAFATSKAPWHEINDDLPQHETWGD
ncbi:MAG: GFA family protein [Gammaproteobacteria bacterium]|nr:GFA family protein [Gammaproteobacteria bacterium]